MLGVQVIKLSGALQVFAPGKEEVENVHGVRREFLDVGTHTHILYNLC
jgi:hypothetical protein